MTLPKAANGKILVLRREHIQRLFPMSAAIDIVRGALEAYSKGAADVPMRTGLSTSSPEGEMLVMPAYLPEADAIGVKIWTRYEMADGSVETSALVVYRDLASRVEVLMDGGYLTDVRTGAMTGVACEFLAPPNAHRLGLIGAGIQAATQLDAVLAATEVSEVVVWSRTGGRLSGFVDQAQRRHPTHRISAADSAEEAIVDSDIVVAATTSLVPVISDELVADGALVCGIGSHALSDAEIDPRTVARARPIVVDSRRGILNSAGDIAGPIREGLITEAAVVELGELVADSSIAGPRGSVAVFKSVGLAALDIAAAKAVTDRALDSAAGDWVTLK